MRDPDPKKRRLALLQQLINDMGLSGPVAPADATSVYTGTDRGTSYEDAAGAALDMFVGEPLRAAGRVADDLVARSSRFWRGSDYEPQASPMDYVGTAVEMVPGIGMASAPISATRRALARKIIGEANPAHVDEIAAAVAKTQGRLSGETRPAMALSKELGVATEVSSYNNRVHGAGPWGIFGGGREPRSYIDSGNIPMYDIDFPDPAHVVPGQVKAESLAEAVDLIKSSSLPKGNIAVFGSGGGVGGVETSFTAHPSQLLGGMLEAGNDPLYVQGRMRNSLSDQGYPSEPGTFARRITPKAAMRPDDPVMVPLGRIGNDPGIPSSESLLSAMQGYVDRTRMGIPEVAKRADQVFEEALESLTPAQRDRLLRTGRLDARGGGDAASGSAHRVVDRAELFNDFKQGAQDVADQYRDNREEIERRIASIAEGLVDDPAAVAKIAADKMAKRAALAPQRAVVDHPSQLEDAFAGFGWGDDVISINSELARASSARSLGRHEATHYTDFDEILSPGDPRYERASFASDGLVEAAMIKDGDFYNEVAPLNLNNTRLADTYSGPGLLGEGLYQAAPAEMFARVNEVRHALSRMKGRGLYDKYSPQDLSAFMSHPRMRDGDMKNFFDLFTPSGESRERSFEAISRLINTLPAAGVGLGVGAGTYAGTQN